MIEPIPGHLHSFKRTGRALVLPAHVSYSSGVKRGSHISSGEKPWARGKRAKRGARSRHLQCYGLHSIHPQPPDQKRHADPGDRALARALVAAEAVGGILKDLLLFGLPLPLFLRAARGADNNLSGGSTPRQHTYMYTRHGAGAHLQL